MTMLLIILAGLLIGASTIYFLMKKNVIKDEDNNGIPDSIDEKIADVKETVEAAKKKVKRVKEEAADVVKAAKEVVKQAKDVADAAKGETRKGRKPKQK